MGYMGYIDSNGDPQGNFTLLARRLDRDKAGFGMYPVGSFLLDHNDTKLLVSSLLKSDIFLLWQTISWLVSPVSFRAHVMHVPIVFYRALITSINEVMLSAAFVCSYVSNITQKLLNRFSQNLAEW